MIYLLEDDENIRELVCYTLNKTEMPASGFSAPSRFWAAMEEKLPDLILLDIMLPGEDGISVLKNLRAAPRTRRIPVIMLTARDSEFDKVTTLDLGADDYITKPFGIMELLARVKAVLRRTSGEKEGDRIYRCGDLEVSVARHSVRAAGQEVQLTYKEFELLCLLLQNRGMVMSRDRILQDIWGYDFDGENRTVDVHIKTLRRKIAPCGDLIETVRGIGYRIGGEAQ